jgi:hypothetical protein
MTQYLTIFSRTIDYKGIVIALRSFSVKQLKLKQSNQERNRLKSARGMNEGGQTKASPTHGRSDLAGAEEKWEQIVISTTEGKIIFNSRQRKRPGDDFSRMILGAHNYFRNIKTRKVKQRQRILDLLGGCEMAIGVVADPEFTETDSRLDLVFAIVRRLDAMIFNGSGMIDKDGAMILDSDGSSEVTK